MEFAYITEYLKVVEYTQWNLLGALRYVLSKTEFTSSDINVIYKMFKQHLESRAEDKNLLKSAQNKARQVFQELYISDQQSKNFSIAKI
ncbi:11567_t:CDS:1, partial [Funneliformis geosporum]